jgi:hypothetical protein
MRSLDRCSGEKRLAMAVVYRAVRDVYNYMNSAGCYEGKITTRDVRKTIDWILSDDYSQLSFLYWVDAGTISINHMFYIVTKSRKCALAVKKYIDSIEVVS